MEYDEGGFKNFRHSVLAGVVSAFLVYISFSIKTTTGTLFSEILWGIVVFIILYALIMWWYKITMFRKINKTNMFKNTHSSN